MRKDISKRKTPFFCVLKGLSNKQKKIFMSYARAQLTNENKCVQTKKI